MGVGIELLLVTGRWVSSLPGAVSVVPAIPGIALLLMAFGGLWLCLWRTRWRALGLAIAALGLTLSAIERRPPDLLVDRDGQIIALRSEQGTLELPPSTSASFTVDNWLRADGDARDPPIAASGSAFRCDTLGCVAAVKGKTIALVRHPAALEEDYRKVDIVVAPFTVGKRYGSAHMVLDRKRLSAEGAHAFYLDGHSMRFETVAAARGRRPWSSEAPARAPIPEASALAAETARAGLESD
jgi:competence protein ComEC